MGMDSHKIFSLGYQAPGAAFNITQRLAAPKRCTLRSLIYIRTHFIQHARHLQCNSHEVQFSPHACTHLHMELTSRSGHDSLYLRNCMDS